MTRTAGLIVLFAILSPASTTAEEIIVRTLPPIGEQPVDDAATSVAKAGQASSGGLLGGTAVAPLAASFGLVPVGIGGLSTAGLLGGAVAAALGGGTGAASTVSTVSTGAP
ncbi:MAG: hypothetical protein AAGG06_16385 [Pseudomonadota bacterium]